MIADPVDVWRSFSAWTVTASDWAYGLVMFAILSAIVAPAVIGMVTWRVKGLEWQAGEAEAYRHLGALDV